MEVARVGQCVRTLYSACDDEFPQGIAKIAVAQICESVGFQTFWQSALETLSDVAIQYIHSIGNSAQFHGNLAGSDAVKEIFQYVSEAEHIPFEKMDQWSANGIEKVDKKRTVEKKF